MRISAIVPAHNEEVRIGRVLDALKNTSCIHEVIVVNDNSTDGTGEVAKKHGAIVLRNETRQGKGQALSRGVSATKDDVLFFCDADIDGLSPPIVEAIIAPVLNGEAEMSVGARASKVRRLGFGWTYSPLLDGQRALTRKLWERVPELLKQGYRVETALNHYASSSVHCVFDIRQTTKEEKVGVIRGTYERYRMYGDIALAHIVSRLQIK